MPRMFKSSFTVKDMMLASSCVALSVSLWMIGTVSDLNLLSWPRFLAGTGSVFFIGVGLGTISMARPVLFGMIMVGVFLGIAAVLGAVVGMIVLLTK
jgi:hypothetical protein